MSFQKFVGLGRLCKDAEMRTTTTGKQVTQLLIAIDRPYTNADGEKEADFFPVTIWGKSAEVAYNGLKKGNRVLVEGRVQIRQFEKDGEKRFVTEIIAERFEFIERRPKAEEEENPPI